MNYKLKICSENDIKSIDFLKPLLYGTTEFNELNKSKCDKVVYVVLYKLEQPIMAICGGIINDKLLLPFSAPFIDLYKYGNNQGEDYHFLFNLINKELKNIYGLKEIQITLPPDFYLKNDSGYIQNALFQNEFLLKKIDVNHYFNLNDLDDYFTNLKSRERRTLKNAIKSGFTFNKVKDVSEAYEVIKKNRIGRGFPLKMSLNQLVEVSSLVDVHSFVVKDVNNISVAAAIVYQLTDEISQVIYWGNDLISESKNSMIFLAYSLIKYYKEQGCNILDIGPSSEDGLLNYGLSNFKQSLGCYATSKLSFQLINS